MPSFVAIITLLSLLSFLYAAKIFSEEIHRLQSVTQPFGGSINHLMEQVLRISMASLLTVLSLVSVMMSCALIWLAMQPSMVG